MKKRGTVMTNNLKSNTSKTRVLGMIGSLGPFIYLVATLTGGYLWTGYSHYSETVSTLTSSGAPNQAILTPLFAAYNICVLLLAVGLYIGIRNKGARVGSTLMALAGACGLLLFWFPQDFPQGPPTTFTGTMHVAIAGIIAFASLASVLEYGLSLRKNASWKTFARFCLIWFPIALMLGGFGAASITTAYAGLAERLSIGSILVWIEIAGVFLFTRSKTLNPAKLT